MFFGGGLEEGWAGARSAGLLGWLWDDWREPGWAIVGGLGWIGLLSGDPLGRGLRERWDLFGNITRQALGICLPC